MLHSASGAQTSHASYHLDLDVFCPTSPSGVGWGLVSSAQFQSFECFTWEPINRCIVIRLWYKKKVDVLITCCIRSRDNITVTWGMGIFFLSVVNILPELCEIYSHLSNWLIILPNTHLGCHNYGRARFSWEKCGKVRTFQSKHLNVRSLGSMLILFCSRTRFACSLWLSWQVAVFVSCSWWVLVLGVGRGSGSRLPLIRSTIFSGA